MNAKINTKKFHYKTRHYYREKKRKRLTEQFVAAERLDLQSFIEIPSSTGTSWKNYVQHRLRMTERGIDSYGTKQYTRIRLDQYIESNRIVDKTAGKLVNYQPSVVFVGAANIAPDSPIKIKKHVRAPGVKKLVHSLKKRGNCFIIFVDEYMTSQHCGRCAKRFPLATRSDRFKKCIDCKPITDLRPAPKIVTTLGNRVLRRRRAVMKREDPQAVLAAERDKRRMLTKVVRYHKNWQTDNDGHVVPTSKLTTVWHRDISAAKLILEKGNFE